MRLGVLIRDTEYRDALVDKLSSYDNDIFVNIITNNIKDASGSVILTDIPPSELGSKALETLRPRTVFIASAGNTGFDDCYSVFKFCSIPVMISELSLVYNRWHGTGLGLDHKARLVTVCCESDAYSAERCRALAGQIIYSHGGKVLILPLSYINDYGVDHDIPGNSLSRLLYSMQCGREKGMEGVTFTDSYGISSLLLKKGRNPVAYLDGDELKALVSGLSGKYDTLIADMGSCFRQENIEIMKGSENIVFFERGRRRTGIEEMLGGDEASRLIRLRITDGTEDVLAMDDCIRKIFGAGENESIKSGDGKEIRG